MLALILSNIIQSKIAYLTKLIFRDCHHCPEVIRLTKTPDFRTSDRSIKPVIPACLILTYSSTMVVSTFQCLLIASQWRPWLMQSKLHWSFHRQQWQGSADKFEKKLKDSREHFVLVCRKFKDSCWKGGRDWGSIIDWTCQLFEVWI